MTHLGMDGLTIAGTNADLTDSIGAAIRFLGGTTSDPTAITDSDILTIPDANLPAIYDAAEMYLVAAMRSQITDVDEVVGPFSAKLSQLPDRLLADWKLLKAKLEDEFGIGGVEAAMGVITQEFAQHEAGSSDTDLS